MTPGACPFCNPDPSRQFMAGELVLGLWDAFPVSPGHALIVTRRHALDWFSATPAEQAALFGALDYARAEVEKTHQPSGYNIGVNVGAAGGQTVPHLHLHLIPRYTGDVSDPTGGVRHVLPKLANYLKAPVGLTPRGCSLVSGGSDDPLLPHLVELLDQATAVDIAVAFTMQSGVNLILPHLRDVLDRGGRIRILTGDYLGISEPNALRLLGDLAGDIQVKVYEAGSISFHPKSYILYRGPGDGTAFVGSSNLSQTALRIGVEWNYRVVTAQDLVGFTHVVLGFERLFALAQAKILTPEWIDQYEQRRRTLPVTEVGLPPEPIPVLPTPHGIQEEALLALQRARSQGAGAGLVVLATGLGKTWLSAFDSNQPQYGRVLFVAHRDEILSQALATFRKIRPAAKLGKYNGEEKAPEADVLFASIQTLNKTKHLRRFGPRDFDYIIIDEFHHADTRTYRALIDYFEPKFLLGLTATPERTDGGDLLALCGENLVYRCDMVEGIRRGLLAPFAYFGVPDIVDFTNIPWRSGRFDEEKLTTALATQTRAQNALEQYRKRAGSRTIGFCVSKVHADFMARFFLEAGLRAVAVHSGDTSAPRAHSLELLEQGELDILFAVDMFNEGVDLPQLDTIMMLRPTESKILWLQQFGRGLRRLEGKCLKVIDYIGNHRSFLVKPRTLLQLQPGDAAVLRALDLLQAGSFDLPAGCSVTYDLEATNILRALLQAPAANQQLQTYYQDFREANGYRPSATEVFHDGYDPRSARSSHGSWLNFVQAMGDLSSAQTQALQAFDGFLQAIEGTPMTRSFKMVVLLAMLAEGAFPGAIPMATLQARVRDLARRYSVVRAEFGTALESPQALQATLEENPIQAWVGGRGTDGTSYFSYADEVFATAFNLPADLQKPARELVRELVDWRLAVYAQRVGSRSEADRIVCRVAQAGGKPILFLPPRERMAGIPQGWVDVEAEGSTYQANFVQIAVNVMHLGDDISNRLPDLLRQWFGVDAGQPGTTSLVAFTRENDTYRLAPFQAEGDAGPRLWAAYPRAKVPPLFGFEFKGREAQSGVVERDGLMLLFVTLDKEEQPEAHRYNDGFETPSTFRWQSQNRTAMASSGGRHLEGHRALGISIHLFVRRKAKVRGVTEPFLYCGPLTFRRWEGEKPISVWWDLVDPVPDRVWQGLGLSGQASLASL